MFCGNLTNIVWNINNATDTRIPTLTSISLKANLSNASTIYDTHCYSAWFKHDRETQAQVKKKAYSE